MYVCVCGKGGENRKYESSVVCMRREGDGEGVYKEIEMTGWRGKQEEEGGVMGTACSSEAVMDNMENSC